MPRKVVRGFHVQVGTQRRDRLLPIEVSVLRLCPPPALSLRHAHELILRTFLGRPVLFLSIQVPTHESRVLQDDWPREESLRYSSPQSLTNAAAGGDAAYANSLSYRVP